jgi:hypothetical protein
VLKFHKDQTLKKTYDKAKSFYAGFMRGGVLKFHMIIMSELGAVKNLLIEESRQFYDMRTCKSVS